MATTPQEALRRATTEQDQDRVFELVRSGLVSIDEAFEVAVELEANPNLVRDLIREGADFNRRLGDYREPALHIAARRGDVTLYRVLRTVKASVSAVDEAGYTLLHSAACGGHVMLLSDALACGLDVNGESEGGETPLSVAMVQLPDDTRVQAEAKARKVVEVLLTNGAKPDARAVREATELGFKGIVERFQALGAKSDGTNPAPPASAPAEDEAKKSKPKQAKRKGPKKRRKSSRLRSRW